MRQCPFCSRQYDDAVKYCPHDGKGLPPPDTFVGQTVDGKYRIDALHGTGGMGAVYRATQVHLERTVALKIVRGDFLKDAIATQRFKREALAVARLKHPHIVTVYDFGVTNDGGAYLVMEFLEGHSLREELVASKRIPIGRAIELMRQICSAVHAAHVEDIVHRDLKPENIFLETSRDGSTVVKVLDFGVAKLRETSDPGPELTMSGTLLGTPLYMSPEQCEGVHLDARADIYSLGCVFFEMLAGRPPFVANTSTAIIIKHASEMPQPPSAFAPDIPPGIEAAIMRSLQKRPAERFQSAAEFGHAVGSVWIPLDSDEPFGPSFSPIHNSEGLIVVDDDVDGMLGSLASVDTPRAGRRRLAVLPFRNVTRDASVDFLGFAIADAVIMQLSGAGGLAVRPSSAIEQFRDGAADVREVRRLLDVDFVVNGTFIKSGGAFQVTAQLVEADLNEIVWQRRIRIRGEDVLELQDSASEEIVAGVREALGLSGTRARPGTAALGATPGGVSSEGAPTPRGVPTPTRVESAARRTGASAGGAPSKPVPTRDPVAFDLFQRARALDDAPAARAEAIEMLERSVALDPDNPEAWSALVARLHAAGAESFKGEDFAARARAAVDRALLLDPAQLAAETAIGQVLVESGKAEEVAERAAGLLAGDESSFPARYALGYAFRFGGLLDRALRELRAVETANPTLVLPQIATVYVQKKLYADALRVVESAPDAGGGGGHVAPLFLVALARGLGGDVAGARDASKRMAQVDANSVYTLMAQVFASRLEGRSVGALLGWLDDIHTEDGELHFWLAQIHAFAGDGDRSVVRLRRAIESGYFNAPYMLADPLLESVRARPDARTILEIARMRHEQFARTAGAS